MVKRILFGGLIFFGLLIFLWEIMLHCNITSVSQLLSWETISEGVSGTLGHTSTELTPYEMGIFFSTFVMLQVWNLFNAKVYRSSRSVLTSLFSKTDVSVGFYAILGVILVGQILIVNALGNFFDVAPLGATDWLLIISVTSPVLILPEIFRNVKLLRDKKCD